MLTLRNKTTGRLEIHVVGDAKLVGFDIDHVERVFFSFPTTTSPRRTGPALHDRDPAVSMLEVCVSVVDGALSVSVYVDCLDAAVGSLVFPVEMLKPKVIKPSKAKRKEK